MKIYTRTGDEGTTALFGGGRVSKNDARVRAYGTVDDLNAHLGLVRSLLQGGALDGPLGEIQSRLFDLGADLATPLDARARSTLAPIDAADAERLEALIDDSEKQIEPLRQFILPGGHQASAALQVARAVARRAEREVVAAGREAEINPAVRVYLNRLSDLLFVLARRVNAEHGVSEARWKVANRVGPE